MYYKADYTRDFMLNSRSNRCTYFYYDKTVIFLNSFSLNIRILLLRVEIFVHNSSSLHKRILFVIKFPWFQYFPKL